MKLPNVRGSNLLRQSVELPRDLGGEWNLLFVPFRQWQQMEVNSWVPQVSQLEQSHPGFRFYELPTIQQRNILAQTFINEGMRAGIPDPATRGRTITLYVDKKAFQRALEMTDEDHIYVLLADREGNILWRARGGYSLQQAASLEHAVQEASLPVETS